MIAALSASGLLAAGESTIGPTLAVIVGTGMAAQWIAWRTQIPSIIALLLAGLMLGPVTGVIDPDELLGGNLFPLVSLSVALILFEGGLDLPPRELRNTGIVVRRLITIGAVITFLIGWYASREIFGISNQAAIVLGAVLVVTGPTVVGPLLRFVRPAGTTGPILRAEGVLIDPIGATAALLAFEIVLLDGANEAILKVAGILALTIIAGAGIGLLAAFVLDEALRRFLIPDQLIVPITFAFVVATFVAANEVQEESGLLTVTVLGMYLARRDTSTVRHVLEFSESLRTLLISALFILLAARIEADALRDVLLPALGFLAVLVLIARPLTVLVAAVSAIFAIRMEAEGIADADKIVPIVFLVIIGTIVVYGFFSGPAARLLGLAEAQATGVLIAGAHATSRGIALQLKEHGIKSLLVDTDPYNVTRSISSGLAARRLNVLAEDAAHNLDLRGIGRLMAFTSNDEVNALATARFAREFGRREVFQLSPGKRRSGETGVPSEYLGRQIGINGVTYTTIDERARQGWKARSTEAGPDLNTAVDDDLFIPLIRVIEEQMVFLCRNDALPVEGIVIGLAAPSFQRELDNAAAEAVEAIEVVEASTLE
jgi:NhaP-type Na+/H+ or K+/H+ antiporter